MLRSLDDMHDYSIDASDGTVGVVKDLYFEDDSWVVRYLVVHTGGWFGGRTVLISPIGLGKPDWTARLLPVALTKEQVRNSPAIDTDKPVSRQQEREYFGYYGYPYYWGGLGMWGGGYYPGYLQPGFIEDQADTAYRLTREQRARRDGDDPHLRSCKAVRGYRIAATDGEIGHVKNMLVDEKSWAIRYLVVDTSHWWNGHQVLIEPRRIREVSWDAQEITVDLTREAVKESPGYEDSQPLQPHERIAGWPVEASRMHDLPRL